MVMVLTGAGMGSAANADGKALLALEYGNNQLPDKNMWHVL